MKRFVLLALASVMLVPPIYANPIAVGVILVPVNPGRIAGANGSQWVTTLWAHNPTDSDARIEADGDLSTWPVLPAHATALLTVPYAGTPHTGFFLNTRSLNGFFSPPDIWLELRTVDSAASGHNAGTAVPLPSLGAFRVGTTIFPNVPANGHSRIKLRIYSTADSNAAVRVFQGDQLLQSATVSLTGADPAPLGRYPAYGEIDVTNAAPSDALRVEVDSTEPAWSFISVTDDVTNEFTIVEPHLPTLIVISNA